MKKIAMIPARYAATRFPAKLMQMLADKTVIRHTYENTLATGLFDEVLVVTDSDIIYREIVTHGGKAKMSRREHESGTDRIAEAVGDMDFDIVVNVQGDEPFVQKRPLEQLLAVFGGEGGGGGRLEKDRRRVEGGRGKERGETKERDRGGNEDRGEGGQVQVASLVQVLKEQRFIDDPNYVKVALDKKNNALFFSRSVIPYPRNQEIVPVYYEHIGVYAFRKEALLQFTAWPVSPLEAVERIECLRYLENGVPIKMVITEYMGVEIDTPADLQRAAGLLGDGSRNKASLP